jgi:hypothetical protein
MAEERIPRTIQTRAEEERPSDKWVPPSLLPSPAPQDGWRFRWVRTSMLDKSDGKNVSSKFRSGWVPVKASECPEIKAMSDIDSRFGEDCIEIGGLLLCKAPEELMRKRSEYYKDLNESQIRAVDNSYFRENDPRMPLLSPERKTRTEFGRG